MNFSDPNVLWIAYSLSNAVAILLLLAAIRSPKLARLLFAMLFFWASWINYSTSSATPEVYLEYGEKAVNLYAAFINGWFRQHISEFVKAIAVGQGLIALGMLLKGIWVRLACIGAIIFLLAIAPLGLYAAFPFSLIAGAACFFILKKDDLNYLWRPRVLFGHKT
ncbi:MAG: hypothetical protein R2824_28300 [Saprospiraceae bacterium]|nr:hypothetical protein [Lewinella sp.]